MRTMLEAMKWWSMNGRRPGAARLGLGVLAASLVGVSPANAQCEAPQWLPGEGVPGIGGWIGPGGAAVQGSVFSATMWDRDGAGPLPARLVIGGDFVIAGNTLTNSIAVWDGQGWEALGTGIFVSHTDGFDTGVMALATLPNGDLVAAGSFRSAGGMPVHSIARWNGSEWSGLGEGLTNTTGDTGFVASLAVLPGGDLIAGGVFELAGTQAANSIARWNGTSWSAMGEGLRTGGGPGSCQALAVRPGGELVAGGSFDAAGEAGALNIAEWNGTGWASYGTGLDAPGDFAFVGALSVLGNGDVVAGGKFTAAGGLGVMNLARWNGAGWADFGNGGTNPEAIISRLILGPGGAVLADGTDFSSAGGGAVTGGASWNGTGWSSLGLPRTSPASSTLIAALPGGELLGFDSQAVSLYHGSGAEWVAFGTGFGFAGQIMAVAPNGDIYVVNDYTFGGSLERNSIVRWDGAAWHPIAAELEGLVLAMAVTPDGELIASERIFSPTGPAVNRVARLGGASWTAIGSTFDGVITSLGVTPSGEIIAGGGFTRVGASPVKGIARWNGTSWSSLGGGITSPGGDVQAISVGPAGEVVVGGSFSEIGGVLASNIARWNGSVWQSLDSGLFGDTFSGVTTLSAGPGGVVVAAGNFFSAGRFLIPVSNIARWDGAGWSDMGNAMDASTIYFSVLAMPNGDVVAGGTFNTLFGDPASNIARWDGAGWSDLGSLDGVAFGIVRRPNGDLAAAGLFNAADGHVAAHFAVYGCVHCDPDLNQDGNADQGDVDYLINVVAGGENSTNIDPDFNHDGNVDQGDVDALLNVVAGGACP